MTERVPMTAKGKIRLIEEISRLKTVERPKIVKEIEEARGHGDLSENAEYHAAKEKQGQIEGRIQYLEDQLSRAEVIDPSKINDSRVMFGVTVKLFDIHTEKELQYTIVGELEANIQKGLISVTSPMARGLIGKEVGDTAIVQTPGGRREFEVVDIVVN